jgi:hypothetical protein
MAPALNLLVRVTVGKVVDGKRLETILRGINVVQGDSTWNCISWVREALEALRADGKALGTSQLDWNIVRDTAMKYCEDKKLQHRFEVGNFNATKAPTYDLLEGREISP